MFAVGRSARRRTHYSQLVTDMNAPLPTEYADCPAWAFGDTPEMADELLELVLLGVKTATCSALDAYGEGLSIAETGAVEVLLDGAGSPRAAIRIVSVVIRRFDEVDADFAAAEGEGDRSLAHWRAAHEEFFRRSGLFRSDMPLVCERFELIEQFTHL